jgi:hypothetical protein
MNEIYTFDSHHELYNLIQSQDEFLNRNPLLRTFKDHLHLAKHGCSCSAEKNENVAIESYKQIYTLENSAFDDIKNLSDSQKIIFKLNGEIIFEI